MTDVRTDVMESKKSNARINSMEPRERLKILTNYSNSVEVDTSVPPKRYYRSGTEMVRMANVYLKEGSLENAYILYMKFLTLFLEKILKHPDVASVTADVKAPTQALIREVLPKTEKLKVELLSYYENEYRKYLQDLAIQQQQQKEAKERQEREKLKKARKPKSASSSSSNSQTNAVVFPIANLDIINFPDENLTPDIPSAPPEEDLKHDPTPAPPTIPTVNRSSKPAKPAPLVHSTSDSIIKAGLRTVIIPSKVMTHFLTLSQHSTDNNIETCGILAGKLERNHLFITHMILPKQKGTADSCVTMNEEEIFDYQDHHNLITIGWIHTHPTQTAFLSSVDLHTQCPYQLLMPEAIAIVCAPKYNKTGIYMLTQDYGLKFIANCKKTGFHPHPPDPPLFKTAEHIRIETSEPLDVLDLR